MSDEAVHYMESTSRLRTDVELLQLRADGFSAQRDEARAEVDRLRAENEELRERLTSAIVNLTLGGHGRAIAAEDTMREVAEELRKEGAWTKESICFDLADRLDPPPVDATRSIHGGVHCAPPGGPHNTCYRQPDGSCESCGYPPPVVENPPA